jgi:transcriptional regulator NrdR family protein
MRESPKASASDAGLHCWKCGGQRFRVVYTRAAAGGKIIRRRACRARRTRITTWEKMIGG